MSVFLENLNHQDATSNMCCKQTIRGKQNCADNTPQLLYSVPCSAFLFSQNVIPVMGVLEESFFLSRVESQNRVSGIGLQQWWLNVVPMHCLWHFAFCSRSGSDEIPRVWEFIVFPQSVLRLHYPCILARKESALSQERLYLFGRLFGIVCPNVFSDLGYLADRFFLCVSFFYSVNLNHNEGCLCAHLLPQSFSECRRCVMSDPPPPITSIWVQELQQRGAGWQSWPGTPRQLRGKHGFRVLLHFCSISLVLSSEPIELTVCWPSVVYWCIFLVNFCYCFIAFFFLICTHILLYRLTSSILNACLFTRHISVLYQEAILVSSAMTSMTSVVKERRQNGRML